MFFSLGMSFKNPLFLIFMNAFKGLYTQTHRFSCCEGLTPLPCCDGFGISHSGVEKNLLEGSGSGDGEAVIQREGRPTSLWSKRNTLYVWRCFCGEGYLYVGVALKTQRETQLHIQSKNPALVCHLSGYRLIAKTKVLIIGCRSISEMFLFHSRGNLFHWKCISNDSLCIKSIRIHCTELWQHGSMLLTIWLISF